MSQKVNSTKAEPKTAREVAASVLLWAKKHNLFGKVPLEDAVEGGKVTFSDDAKLFLSQNVQTILRQKAINLVTFNEKEKKVTIFINGKLNKTEEKELPLSISGYNIEYIQGGIAQVRGNPPEVEAATPHKIYKNRYACGSSIFPAKCIGAGTLGLIVSDDNGKLYGMTNNHVAGACNHAMPGLPILAPGPLDATEDSCDPFTIGRHTKLLPINDGIPENIEVSINCDVSIFELVDDDKVSSMQGSFYDTPATAEEPEPGTVVEKVGRTTGRTKGTIVGQTAVPLPVAYQIAEYDIKKTVFFDKVYVVQGWDGLPFSKGGDSGSLVVTEKSDGSKVAVGLVFAGNEHRGLSYILPLPDVLKKLSVGIVSGHNV
ncbi:hypothetical protein AD951_12570 [Acetobacter malorum]|uniref:Nal1 C-terminal domain-containing protein n=1 Tax=Acetobacter malorum TaxID=178901 RepID=A0A149UJJ8_9PROT|nr:hypothetical protein [Acetobacter malorum]KXV68150.1 hypothetical protein AD951_12570 [Acetobacter malorum]